MLPYSDEMTFVQRMYNAYVTVYDWIIRRFVFLPAEAALVKKHFSHLEPLPTLDELIHNVSLNFVNTHRALSPPRPSMPGEQTYALLHLSKWIQLSQIQIELSKWATSLISFIKEP